MSKCIIPWTKSEDDTIINAIINRKGAKTAVFYRLSKSMNRTELAISQRYYAELAKKSFKPVATETSKEVKPVETNLEKAIRLYPVGTQFRSLYDDDKIFIVNKIPYYSGRDIFINDGYGKVYCSFTNKWAEIIPTPEQQEIKESPKQKGIFLDENKLQSLSLGFLRELAVTRLVTLDKENLIKLIVE